MVRGLARRHGEAVQVDPIKPKLKAPGTKRLKVQCDEPLSNFAFKSNSRRYMLARDYSTQRIFDLSTDHKPESESEQVRHSHSCQPTVTPINQPTLTPIKLLSLPSTNPLSLLSSYCHSHQATHSHSYQPTHAPINQAALTPINQLTLPSTNPLSLLATHSRSYP